MDHAARVLGVDPAELRRRNFIRDYPYKMMNGETITVGDFDRVLNRLLREADHNGYAARKAESASRGMIRGKGLACYVEAILGSPFETARVDFEDAGTVALYVGTQSNGQGHETVYTSLLSAQTGIDESLIRIIQGDSDLIAQGGGTGGSRSVTVQGTAITAVTRSLVAAMITFLETDLGDGVFFEEGRFGAPASNLRLTMVEAADKARAAGRNDLLSHSQTIKLEGRSFPNGAHWAEVEIDPETGVVRLDRYIVTDDFGVLLNPQFVEGQVHGGVAQGFGQAVTENAVYDERGQLLTASFMDYGMPRADDLPMIHFSTEPVPSPHNPFGMKGCGEAGTVGSLGAISNAVTDALTMIGAQPIDMPFTPLRIWQAIESAQTRKDAS
jgi:carbon-monoxide dehydrogenase large subunit